MPEPIEVEKIASDRYRLRFRGQVMTVDAQALRDLYDWCLLHMMSLEQEARQEKPETSYLDDPTRVEPGWLGETYDEGQKIIEYNRRMDERDRIIRENIDKPWLPLHDGE